MRCAETIRASWAMPSASSVSAAWRMVAQSDWLPMMMATSARLSGHGLRLSGCDKRAISGIRPAPQAMRRLRDPASGDDVGNDPVFEVLQPVLERSFFFFMRWICSASQPIGDHRVDRGIEIRSVPVSTVQTPDEFRPVPVPTCLPSAEISGAAGSAASRAGPDALATGARPYHISPRQEMLLHGHSTFQVVRWQSVIVPSLAHLAVRRRRDGATRKP